MHKKEVIGRSMILLGSLIMVSIFISTYNNPLITGNFFANDVSSPIMIKSLDSKPGSLFIIYSVDNSYFNKDNISVDIWISDDKNFEIKRIKDFFPNQENLVREILIDLSSGKSGVYSVYLAPSYNLGDYARGNFVIGESLTTGYSILDKPRDKMIAYGVFLIIIGTGIVLIMMSRWREREKGPAKKASRKRRR